MDFLLFAVVWLTIHVTVHKILKQQLEAKFLSEIIAFWFLSRGENDAHYIKLRFLIKTMLTGNSFNDFNPRYKWRRKWDMLREKTCKLSA